jgi:hypothetical protein
VAEEAVLKTGDPVLTRDFADVEATDAKKEVTALSIV